MDSWKASTSHQPVEINWELSVLCQQETSESLVCPLLSKRKDIGKGYHSLAENLAKFDELGKLPRNLQLSRIDEGQGIEEALITNEAKWHKTCRLRYNNQMLKRAEGITCTKLQLLPYIFCLIHPYIFCNIGPMTIIVIPVQAKLQWILKHDVIAITASKAHAPHFDHAHLNHGT